MAERPILFCGLMVQKTIFGQDIEVDELKCPYGQVGDFLWVRETYCLGVKDNGEDVTIYKYTSM